MQVCRGAEPAAGGRSQDTSGAGGSSDGDVVLSQFGHEVLVRQIVPRDYSDNLEDRTDDKQSHQT